MYNVRISRFKIKSQRSILSTMLLSSSAIPYTEKAGILYVSTLLTKKEGHHLKVNTDDPIVFVILQ